MVMCGQLEKVAPYIDFLNPQEDLRLVHEYPASSRSKTVTALVLLLT
jgi:hypothetical protein